jgi:hypothetical protein
MNLVPFQKVTDVPTFEAQVTYTRSPKDFSDVMSSHDFIDISSIFALKIVRGIRESWYVGISAYMFDAQVNFGFDEGYRIVDISFSKPFNFGGVDALSYEGINLFQPTLLATKTILDNAGIKTKLIDVGFEAPDLGVSFFSDEYDEDLNVRLDAVTVSFAPREK